MLQPTKVLIRCDGGITIGADGGIDGSVDVSTTIINVTTITNHIANTTITNICTIRYHSGAHSHIQWSLILVCEASVRIIDLHG